MASRFLAIGALAVLGTAAQAALAEGAAHSLVNGSARDATYENAAPRFSTLSSSGSNAGEYLLNFDATGATNTTTLPVGIAPIPPGGSIAVLVQWDQRSVAGMPASATSGIDLCIRGTTGTVTVTDNDGNAVSCTGPSAAGADSYQVLFLANPTHSAGDSQQQTLSLILGLAANSSGTRAPDRISIAVQGGAGSTIDAFSTNDVATEAHLHSAMPAAAAAAAAAPAAPAAPTLTLGATTIEGPGATVITWSSVNALYCTPSGNTNTENLGSWIGTLPPSGEYTETPFTAGTYIFTLSCSNASGTSPPTSVTLTVTPSPNTGGGGALDGWMLMALAALSLSRRLPRSPYSPECRRG